MSSAPSRPLQRLARWLLRGATRVYFRRIECFHAERVPRTGPVMFASNHPNSLTDAFVIGTSVPRLVHFVATVQLFRRRPLAWLLRHCGVIPVNRLRDDASAMRSVTETFEACFRVLERGEAIGIFPEGITHDDPHLKAIKTGAARMALELEHRHQGRLDLSLVPVGLIYSAKERFRSEVLVNFGEPLRVADYLSGYAERRRQCIHHLNEALEQRLQALIVHIPQLEHARIVEAVKRLYLDRLGLGNTLIHELLSPRAEELALTQAITDAVRFTIEHAPEQAERFVHQLALYEGWLRRLQLSDAAVEQLARRGSFAWHSLGRALVALVGAPVAVYGGLHQMAPLAVVRWARRRFVEAEKGRAQISTATMIAGAVAFGGCYTAYAAVFRQFFSLVPTLAYAVSLPVTGLLAYYYFRSLRGLVGGVRDLLVLLRLPLARRRLVTLRRALIDKIETARADYRRARGL